jgi:16S rRNA (adenine1518-N6/adenine1519-N6)-dimethyltransferase
LNEDALQFNFAEIANENTVIISNLPYNVGTKILLHVGTTTLSKIRSMVVMLQKDVIEKITAKHGSKNYHQLGVFFQTFCEIEQICVVGQSCFSPVPNVLSAVVKISPITQIPHIQQYWKFLHKAFSYNRKMLSTIFDETIGEKFAKKRPNELKPNELLEVFLGTCLISF